MKCLIAYFSREGNNYVAGGIVNLRKGNTEAAAEMIRELAGGDLFRIATVREYPGDYNEAARVAQRELAEKARPELRDTVADIGRYDAIFLGYPNWWNTMPMAVCTFLESLDLEGRKIIPFCTHEGSGLGSSVRDIQRLCPKARVLEGLAIRGSGVNRAGKEISAWLARIGVLEGSS